MGDLEISKTQNYDISNYRSNERVSIMLGGVIVFFAFGLLRDSYLKDRGISEVPVRKTGLVEQGGLYIPVTASEVEADMDAGDFVTVDVNGDGDFLGTHVDDYPEDGVVFVKSSLSNLERLKGLSNVRPITMIPSSIEPAITAIKAKSPTPESVRKQSASLADAFKSTITIPNMRYVIFDEPQDADLDLRSAINGEPQSQGHINRGKALAKLFASRLSQ